VSARAAISASGIPAFAYYDLLGQERARRCRFFLDPYSRTEKRSGAWMDECVVAKALPPARLLPVAAAGLQISQPPWAAQPSQLNA